MTYLTDIGEWFVILNHHLSELCPLFRVDPHQAPQQEYVIRRVVNLLRIQNDLLELSSLRETLDHLKIWFIL